MANPNWKKGMPSPNPVGRPVLGEEREKEKLTNRKLREKAFLELVRKFRPLQAKAIQAAVKILDDEKAADQNKLKASALIIATYKDLLSQVYDYRYDEEEAVPMQEESAPILSLTVVSNNKE